MSLFHLVGGVITLVALFGYVNARWLRLPEVIGTTLIGLVFSLAVAIVGVWNPSVAEWAAHTSTHLDFDELVFHGLLGLLLFAGSLHVNLTDLAGERWPILILATFGLVLSTALVGLGLWVIVAVLGLGVPLVVCLLFGALISPTDPIAVLGILQKVGAPKNLETVIVGESLFNDGVGVVLFLTLLGIATGSHEASGSAVLTLLAHEVLGGLVVGALIGAVGLYLLRGIDAYATEILITFAMATMGYAAAEALHTSAPIAAVVMGLVVGNFGRQMAMSEKTRQHLFSFWDLTDELLNLLLFGLIGFEIIVVWNSLDDSIWLPCVAAIPMVLLARWISVGLPIQALRHLLPFSPHTIKVMTWGGLRGGISVALALSLPDIPGRDLLISATYGVVIFSIGVQALTVGPLAARLKVGGQRPPGVPHH